jgi:hypothetical protein
MLAERAAAGEAEGIGPDLFGLVLAAPGSEPRGWGRRRVWLGQRAWDVGGEVVGGVGEHDVGE